MSDPDYAIVEYKLIRTLDSRSYDVMDVRLGGALLKECICWVRGAVRTTRDTDNFELQLSEFTWKLEHKVKEFWLARRRESRVCLKCGLPRWGPDIEDNDDEHEDEPTDEAEGEGEQEDEEMDEAGREAGDTGGDEEDSPVVI
ncbi:hypothetical protein LTR97_003758 [Elasticomyces elasticus]|uniref:Uncharacterized protein n=1 Tax=Elasticomyces elasticus TaxID=574655 RepID=A0AAN7ZPC4_9PEZI|nr:hypothetical protein LTR97_003758 [Elasticomyces elasticus]